MSRSDTIFLHFILKGSCLLTMGADQVVECRAGDVAIVVSGESHKIRNANGTPVAAPEEFSAADPGDVPARLRVGEGLAQSEILSGKIELIWPLGNRPSRLPLTLFTSAKELGLDLPQYVEEGRLRGGSAVLTLLARLIFARAVRDNPICWRQFELNLDDPITRAKVLIEKYPFRPWTVETLAAEVGMGRSNFATKFAQRFDATPIHALTAERMKHAAQLLSDTRFKVSEVSDRTGYRSEAAFIGRFKDHFGMTPARWRRLHPAKTDSAIEAMNVRKPLWSQLAR